MRPLSHGFGGLVGRSLAWRPRGLNNVGFRVLGFRVLGFRVWVGATRIDLRAFEFEVLADSESQLQVACEIRTSWFEINLI